MKNPLTLAGIERATFRFVAQHLNHRATAIPVFHGTRNINSPDKRLALLHKYCLKYLPSTKYDSVLQFRDIVLSWLVVQIFSGWFWDGCCGPVITGITFIFAFHIRRLSVVRPSYLKIFLASFLITFLSSEFTLPLSRHVPVSLWSTVMSGELWGRFCPFALFDSVIRLT